jgi:hypothetical protein
MVASQGGMLLTRAPERQLLSNADMIFAYAGEILCSCDGLNVLPCALILLSRVDAVFIWGGSYHLRW